MMDQPVRIVLISMNQTFDRKKLTVPYSPESLTLGRHFDDATTSTPTNGFFDSKVLSKQHTEVWAERDGKVYVRDLKSSNGTYVNGHRLSPENRRSEPHELRHGDTLELGVDIVGESRAYYKVAAKVEIVGLAGDTADVVAS